MLRLLYSLVTALLYEHINLYSCDVLVLIFRMVSSYFIFLHLQGVKSIPYYTHIIAQFVSSNAIHLYNSTITALWLKCYFTAW